MGVLPEKRGLQAEPMSIRDLDDLVQLHEEYINYGASVRPFYRSVLSNPENISLKCCVDGEMAGFFTFTKGLLLSGTHRELAARLESLTAGRSTFTADAAVVKPEYRKLGLAGILCEAGIREMNRRGVELLFCEILIYPDGHMPSEKMLSVFQKYVGFGRIEGYFGDLYKFGYFCSICGFPCKCSADVRLCEVPLLPDETGELT